MGWHGLQGWEGSAAKPPLEAAPAGFPFQALLLKILKAPRKRPFLKTVSADSLGELGAQPMGASAAQGRSRVRMRRGCAGNGSCLRLTQRIYSSSSPDQEDAPLSPSKLTAGFARQKTSLYLTPSLPHYSRFTLISMEAQCLAPWSTEQLIKENENSVPSCKMIWYSRFASSAIFLLNVKTKPFISYTQI